MFTYNKLDKALGLDSLKLAVTKELDEDTFALISSLIDQNAELMLKLQALNSQKELANIPEIKAHDKEATRGCPLEREARDKASTIISEAETKARTEADRILAEAKRKAEEIVEEKTQFAIQQGLLIINKSQERALSILNEVRQQAEAITTKDNHKVKPR